MEEIQSLCQVIQGKRVLSMQEDLVIHREAMDRRFSVKLFYRILDHLVAVLFPHHLVCNTWIPTKVGFFTWEAS